MTPPTTTAEGVRARARTEMRQAILDTARAHLVEQGATGLSLRAVARDVGMVSSALYRYFENRDALLTALIIEAYDSLGEAAERAEARVDRDDLEGRWLAVATTVRGWALAHPHQYALVYGSPVPGYRAPQDTIGPATRVAALLAGLLRDIAGGDDGADAAGGPAAGAGTEPPADAVAAVAPMRAFLGEQVPADLALRGLLAWTAVFGLVSFELFGQLHNVVEPDGREAVFEAEARRLARQVLVTG
ncbi:TetR/AcrR family transcriptional regulator [Aquipuribacter sp. SD81]|uniref:TetR/AcrR family transcriptional regulator n=1 Tax=Aquipuribacter sp. SD81 TaxID=3127703 RepID=UPI00301669CF